jgi:hypothetical protein
MWRVFSSAFELPELAFSRYTFALVSWYAPEMSTLQLLAVLAGGFCAMAPPTTVALSASEDSAVLLQAYMRCLPE